MHPTPRPDPHPVSIPAWPHGLCTCRRSPRSRPGSCGPAGTRTSGPRTGPPTPAPARSWPGSGDTRSMITGMPGGRSFALAFGTYTRLTGTGSQARMLRCTRTASAILAGEVSATSPSIPAVARPVLRCVTCRTLTSVSGQDRSIIFCRDLTLARSCSLAALKILRRSRPTLSSCSRQLMASHSKVTSSVPFTVMVSNLSLGSGVSSASPAKAHPPHVSLLSQPGTRPGIRPVMRRAPGWRTGTSAPAFPLPSGCRHWLLGRPVPARESRFPYGRLAGGAPAAPPDPDG
jgi:hypothetical protein